MQGYLGIMGTMAKDGRHPIKLVSDFIKKVKHTITDDDFPISSLNRFFSVSAHILSKEWYNVKDDEEQKKEYIEKMENAQKELEEEGSLKKKENIDDT